MKPQATHEIKGKKPRVPISKQRQTAPSPSTQTKPPVSPSEDIHILIAKRAYELYGERDYRHGSALDDWLEAEREILSQIPP
jgi:Protein of unknown function (DUF2934)